jgi:hypothetical protein
MKYLLFISYESGLMHNAVYENLPILHDSVNQLAEEENLNLKSESLPSLNELEKHFMKNEDYFNSLSNETWYHIQEFTERNYIKDV